VDAIAGAEAAMGNLVAGVGDKVDLHVAGVRPAVVHRLAGDAPAHVVGADLWSHARLLRRLRPNLVQVNLEVPWAAPVMLAVALAAPGVRVVGVEHMGVRTTRPGRLLRTRATALRLDAHVAVSVDTAWRVESFYALGRGSVRIVHNGAALDRVAAPIRYGAPDALVVGCVGRLDPVKGHEVLLRALARLPGVHAVIVGDGPRRAALRRLAADFGVADRCTLPGHFDRVADALAGFDVFCQPSYYDGPGLTVVEAMLAGLPCVATGVGGVPEVFDGGRCGVLVPPGDPAALADALAALRADPARRALLGECGRARARAEFTVERMAAAYEALWDEVIDTPRVPRLWPAHPRP
jgi:glycosyltransferase involved in cell wall biosynthesis